MSDTRTRILEAAYRLFCERGIDLTTTREIAHEAECNEITLFRHFGNKETLVREVIEWYVPAQEAPRLTGAISGEDLEADLLALTREIMRFHSERETFFRFVFANIVQHPEHSAFIERIQEPYLLALRELFARYVPPDAGLDLDTIVHDFITPIAMRTFGRVFLGFEQIPEAPFAETHARLIARALTCPGTTGAH
ncbi:MAG: TetR/AcrR family transcriptional regulator [Candidatus Dadabacteria bacterium]|nr:MAG: TetR/AcrR family transcriptional regulator [Candidatus Dadabacteria bacterium]